MKLIYIIIICLALILFACLLEGAEIPDNQIVNAIFKAEGGYKADYLYGIRSVKYKDIAEARQICLNTVRNQRRRHFKHKCDRNYLECLSARYAPLNAKNDPKGLNRNWLKNVKFFLKH